MVDNLDQRIPGPLPLFYPRSYQRGVHSALTTPHTSLHKWPTQTSNAKVLLPTHPDQHKRVGKKLINYKLWWCPKPVFWIWRKTALERVSGFMIDRVGKLIKTFLFREERSVDEWQVHFWKIHILFPPISLYVIQITSLSLKISTYPNLGTFNCLQTALIETSWQIIFLKTWSETFYCPQLSENECYETRTINPTSRAVFPNPSHELQHWNWAFTFWWYIAKMH